MSSSTADHLAALRSALLALKPAGQTGFEGLLAVVLGAICGQPFRLASSGTQRGRDGDSAFDAGATYFEGKRYRDEVPKDEIATKLMDLKIDDRGQVDTWIVGATAPIPALRAGDFRALAQSYGIGIILLDWSYTTALPPLALAITIGGQGAKAFLQLHLGARAIVKGACDAIDHLAVLPDFNSSAEAIRAALRNTSIGLGLAKVANHAWLEGVFSNQIRARQHFGQPLAPKDPSAIGNVDRATLSNELRPAFTGTPSSRVFAIVGPEGSGKSWLVANTWMKARPASLLVFATADELRHPADTINIDEFLIRKLIDQTDGDNSEAKTRRWQRRFAAWRANPAPENVRIALCVDGLNQSENFPWPRFLDAASLVLDRLGGQLIITTRTTHFPAIRSATAASIERVLVPEWAKSELDKILISRSITPDVLSQDVFNTLKNPRILGIALTLLDASIIENIEDLSVGRLLFEHLRQSSLTGVATISGFEFAKALQELAAEFIKRVRSNDHDDLTLFDARFHRRLHAVASSRFFRPVGDDPDRYEIVNEGLQLGLGLWLVDALEKEVRNSRDPESQLHAILEPVAALDMISDVVASAIEIACLREPCPVTVASVLICHYSALQNVQRERTNALAALVKTAPEPFVQAAKNVALKGGHASNSEWLTNAIISARDDISVRQVLHSHLPEWLSTYSLAPERLMFANEKSDPVEKVSAERKQAIERLGKKLHRMTEPERKYLRENLRARESGNLDRLHRQAFLLLAGMPLAPFAASLVAWAFGNALNSSFGAPVDDLEFLIRFDYVDWHATRTALLATIESMPPDRSTVSEWAIARILRATGDSDDASSADTLIERLTEDRERFGGWRLVESYCATDPCDPSSTRPDNIGATAERYRHMKVEELRSSRGSTSEDHFFDAALPGIARFEPNIGVEVFRRLAKQALLRKGVPRWLAILTIVPAAVLLDVPTVEALVSDAQAQSEPLAHEEIARDEWATAQYSLFAAFPHLSGNDQLSALARMHGNAILIKLLGAMKAADMVLAESLLREAVADNDEDKLARLFAALKHGGSALTDSTKSLATSYLTSTNKMIRALVLGIVADSDDPNLLLQVAQSNWDAGRLSPENDQFEIWYGSAALLNGVKRGVLPLIEALDRMALTHYGFVAASLGLEGASAVADRIDVALAKVSELTELSELPDMERKSPGQPASPPPLVDLNTDTVPADASAALSRLSESTEQFQERQQRLRDAYRRFSRTITNSDAHLLLTDITFAGMNAVVAGRPDIVTRWYNVLIAASEERKRGLQLFAVQFASSIAKENEYMAISLFRAYSGIRPLIRHVIGYSKTPVEIEALWSQAHIPAITIECLKRLDHARTDQELAIEVVAAFRNKAIDVLESYIQKLVSSGEPARIVRAVTVAGFSDDCSFSDALLLRFSRAKGFVGTAYEMAKFAYDRNRWARHWYSKMATAENSSDFWRYSVLFEKIVDGRFDLWADEAPKGPVFEAFFTTLEQEIEQRIKRWSDKRRDKLFGGKLPSQTFLLH